LIFIHGIFRVQMVNFVPILEIWLEFVPTKRFKFIQYFKGRGINFLSLD
jgi:hypothetical protein